MSPGELRPELVRTVEHLAARWPRAHASILKHVFPLLARGRPVSVSRLAQAAGTSMIAVREACGPGRVELDENGDVESVFGVTLQATLHRVVLEAANLHTCCALVSHVLPRLLRRQVEVFSRDPLTDECIRLVIAREGVRISAPDTAVASMVITDENSLCRDAPVHFCRHVHHFRSRRSAEAFVASDANRYIVTIAELDAVAERVHAEVWS